MTVWGLIYSEDFISSLVTQFSTDGPSLLISFCYNADFRGKDCLLSVGSLKGGGEDFSETRAGQFDQTQPQASRQRTESNSLFVLVWAQQTRWLC